MTKPLTLAIFGIPGSGKSTIARWFSQNMNPIKVIEASRHLLQLPLTLPLPDSIDELIPLLTRDRTLHPRHHALSIRRRLIETYHPLIIGEIMVRLTDYYRKPPHRTIILSGVRGFEQAQYLKEKGYLIIYIDCSESLAIQRLCARDQVRSIVARTELAEEEAFYQTSRIQTIADIVHQSSDPPEKLLHTLIPPEEEIIPSKECRICLNSDINPTMTIDDHGLCTVCRLYTRMYSPQECERELTDIMNKKYGNRVLVGISGGKDSSMLLKTVKDLGYHATAFTLESGYYPPSIIPRSQEISDTLHCHHTIFDIRHKFTACDRQSFSETTELFAQEPTPKLSQMFRVTYVRNRAKHAITHDVVLPYVQSCILCRRAVIRSYYELALRQDIPLIFLGMNEWAYQEKTHLSGIRQLCPQRGKPVVRVVHLPFILRQSLNWRVPMHEDLIETNNNSCLFAAATNPMATRMLRFHPDTTRLSREITAGFLTKDQARSALLKPPRPSPPLSEVLATAGLISKST